MVYLFNVGALFVLFRESLEAAIVVGVLLNYIRKTLPKHPDLQKRLRRQVWMGAGAGVAVSVVLGVTFTVIFYVLATDVFASIATIWSGTMQIIAVLLISVMAFSMLKTRDWYGKWEAKLEAELERQKLAHGPGLDEDQHAPEHVVVGENLLVAPANASTDPLNTSDAVHYQEEIHVDDIHKGKSAALDADAVSLSSGSSSSLSVKVPAPDYNDGLSKRPYAILILAFITVVREGLESVVFLTGVGQGDPFSIIIPGVIGIILGLTVGYVLYRSSSRFPLRAFLLASAIVLFFIAAGLAAGAARAFELYAYAKSGEAWTAEWNATATQPLTVAESPANTFAPSNITLEPTGDVPWSAARRTRVTSPLCPAVNSTIAAPTSCVQRTYYIAAEFETWDYAPSGFDHLSGTPFIRAQEESGKYTLHGNGKIGAVYDKVVYREYEDETFTKRKARQGNWLGFLGPVIRAEVGDILQIVFFNNASFTASMHPHGLSYTRPNEGAFVEWNDQGNAINPGETYNYTWFAHETSGPVAGGGNAAMWAYHSHVHETADIFTGLVGPLVVYAPGTLDENDKPTDVDREYVTLFMVADENQSLLLNDNVAKYVPELDAGNNKAPVDPDSGVVDTSNPLADPAFIESNLMHSVNGRMYNNLDGLEMIKGERVRWLAFTFGNEADLHTAHWHGNTLIEVGELYRTDVIPLLPASFRVATMLVVNPGQWLLHCHVSDHLLAGMIASYHVKDNATNETVSWDATTADHEFVPAPATMSPVLWDTSSCCSEATNPFFQVLNSLIGWQSVATVATVCTYFGYWALVIVGCLLVRRSTRRKQRKEREMALTEKGEWKDGA